MRVSSIRVCPAARILRIEGGLHHIERGRGALAATRSAWSLAVTPFRPALVCGALFTALDASEGRRRRRKRDTTPDAIGMLLKTPAAGPGDRGGSRSRRLRDVAARPVPHQSRGCLNGGAVGHGARGDRRMAAGRSLSRLPRVAGGGCPV